MRRHICTFSAIPHSHSYVNGETMMNELSPSFLSPAAVGCAVQLQSCHSIESIGARIELHLMSSWMVLKSCCIVVSDTATVLKGIFHPPKYVCCLYFICGCMCENSEYSFGTKYSHRYGTQHTVSLNTTLNMLHALITHIQYIIHSQLRFSVTQESDWIARMYYAFFTIFNRTSSKWFYGVFMSEIHFCS